MAATFTRDEVDRAFALANRAADALTERLTAEFGTDKAPYLFTMTIAAITALGFAKNA
jgi:hypothetical protein